MPGFNRRMYRPRKGAVTIGKPNTNTAVKKTIAKTQNRIYKKKSTTANKALVNRMALMTLSKQVTQLQRSKLGEYQTCRLRTGFQPTWTNILDEPVCFCVNDFNNSYVTNVGAPIYRGNAASYSKVGNLAQITNQPVSADAVDYFYKEENNTASKIVYAPISTSFAVQCQKNMATGDEPIWIRIDIVKQKKIVSNLVRKLHLPDSICGLSKMAIENVSYRNKYNKEFITVLQTKYIRLNNADSALKEIRGSANFYVKFDPRKPVRTDSEADGSTNTENDFYNNVNPLEMVWCIINFSTPHNLTGLDVNIIKQDRWYDQHGTD